MKFEISKSKKDKKYSFNLKARNYRVILSSQEYSSIYSALKGISSVRKNCGDTNRFARKKSSQRQYQFHLLAPNNQPIGHSQIYTTRWGMEKGIRSVMTNAPEAIAINKDTGKQIK